MKREVLKTIDGWGPAVIIDYELADHGISMEFSTYLVTSLPQTGASADELHPVGLNEVASGYICYNGEIRCFLGENGCTTEFWKNRDYDEFWEAFLLTRDFARKFAKEVAMKP